MLSAFILGGQSGRSGATISFLGFFRFLGRLSCDRFVRFSNTIYFSFADFFFFYSFKFRIWKNVL